MSAGPSLPASDRGDVLAFDVGGTDVKSAVITADGEVRDVRRTPTPRSDDDPAGALVDGIATLVKARTAEDPSLSPTAVGLVVPGIVDEATGVGVYSGNLGWRDVPLAHMLAAETGLPVGFGHDVRAAGRAELELGAARGLSDVVIIAIGTGIAGALVVGGRPVVGGGFAGELGHTLADPDGDPCVCGARGCLETIASAGAVARRYAARTGHQVAGAAAVASAIALDDPVARAVWSEAVDALAEHIARLAAVLAPEAVVIGGGLADAGPTLFAPLRERVDELLSFHRRPRVLPAELGADAGLLGSALIARDRMAS